MITATLLLASGALREFRVHGHDMRRKGSDSIPCAGVSLLTRAAGLEAVERNLVIDGSAERTGDFSMILHDSVEYHQWLCGFSSLLQRGLQTLADEYPSSVRVIVQEVDNGT